MRDDKVGHLTESNVQIHRNSRSFQEFLQNKIPAMVGSLRY